MFRQEDFGQPEKSLEKTREIDNEARISEKAEMKKKIQQKSEADNSVRHPAKLFNILGKRKVINGIHMDLYMIRLNVIIFCYTYSKAV